MNDKVKKIWNRITGILVGIVVLFCLLTVVPRLFGINVFTVLSSSMEPAYHTGAIIYVKKVDPKNIEPGRVITFALNETTIATHRVVEVVQDCDDVTRLLFKTKGDANQTVDGGLVDERNVIGAPFATIPYLGYAINFVQNKPGIYISAVIGGILLIMVILPDLIGERKTKEKESIV